jgi:cytochrome P450
VLSHIQQRDQYYKGKDDATLASESKQMDFLGQFLLEKRMNHGSVDSSFVWCYPSYKDAQQTPYLNAVIKDALRLHPPVGLGLERAVLPTGLQLTDGTYFQPGTLASMNAWVLHRPSGVFGDDVNHVHPERWLQSLDESSEDYEDRLKGMGQSNFTFGHGPRTCIGENTSLLEIHKVVAALFLAFGHEDH